MSISSGGDSGKSSPDSGVTGLLELAFGVASLECLRFFFLDLLYGVTSFCIKRVLSAIVESCLNLWNFDEHLHGL